jgi:hypothetical protein
VVVPVNRDVRHWIVVKASRNPSPPSSPLDTGTRFNHDGDILKMKTVAKPVMSHRSSFENLRTNGDSLPPILLWAGLGERCVEYR